MSKITSCLYVVIIFSFIYNSSYSESAINDDSKKQNISYSIDKKVNQQNQKLDSLSNSGNRINKSKNENNNTKSIGNNVIESQNSKKNDSKNNEKFYIVQNGDNIYRIAMKYKVSQSDILAKNNLQNANIFVGQKLLLPDNAVYENNADAKDIQAIDQKSNKNNGNNTENNAKEQSVIAKNEEIENKNLNKVEIVNENKEKQTNLVSKIDSTTFIWPARGIPLKKFGHQMSGGKLEGIIIGGEAETAVRASSSGIVSYNDKVMGYGNVILITHYNGFITAYGYVDPLVSVGDRVKKGQVIAHMSKEPKSRRSQLYFSIRKDKNSYNPEKIIQTKISN